MMLGRDSKILHARILRESSPLARIIKIRVKVVVILLVLLGRHPLRLLEPLATGPAGINAPVNKQPEAIVLVPGAVWARWCALASRFLFRRCFLRVFSHC